jgi:hypothetical protein
MRTNGYASQGRNTPIVAICRHVLLALVLCPPQALAYRNYDYSSAAVNQENSQAIATKINNDGSDDSEDDGIKHGTIALTCLGALNIPCAFHYGYKGYGNYINSQKLDDLHKVTRNLDHTMNSIGYGAVGGQGSGSGASQVDQSTVTGSARKWADKDTSFLYKGEMNDVAAQFEKNSGMSRETLFKHIASAADAGLNWDDPNLLNKLEQRYHAFASGITNPTFKSNLDKAYSVYTLGKKLDLLGEFRDFYVKNRYGDKNAPNSRLAENGVAAGPVNGSAMPSGTAASPEEASRGLASAETPAGSVNHSTSPSAPSEEYLSKEDGMYLGLDAKSGDLFKDIQDSDSIFRIVSKKYRKLTPALIGKAFTINAR